MQSTTEILWFGLFCDLRWCRNWNRVLNAISPKGYATRLAVGHAKSDRIPKGVTSRLFTLVITPSGLNPYSH
ncbi:hypothetical protein [Moorena sp. SIO3I6]|uniref:hypothetical protein n=1 Tax=Moorena sp. SIO3I6 TaxID=2607831 RepID=UPI0013FADAE8|nr:hypothetical protein [Moorena sp. SIO3I6]NEP28780.1 hypothetical protein [Moorena sp. SIO3I6]